MPKKDDIPELWSEEKYLEPALEQKAQEEGPRKIAKRFKLFEAHFNVPEELDKKILPGLPESPKHKMS